MPSQIGRHRGNGLGAAPYVRQSMATIAPFVALPKRGDIGATVETTRVPVSQQSRGSLLHQTRAPLQTPHSLTGGFLEAMTLPSPRVTIGAMNFFEILFWMGMLCFLPILIIVIRDAYRATRPLPLLVTAASPPQREMNPMDRVPRDGVSPQPGQAGRAVLSEPRQAVESGQYR
jgi:hypothetical protein